LHPQRGGARSWLPVLGVLAVLLGGYFAFANGLRGGFVFDDEEMIAKVHTRPLWPPSEAFAGPRPVTDFSFALNYRLLGRGPWGFRLVNVLIHLGAGLALFGILRRTFRSPVLSDRFAGPADGLALAAALLWVVHPLQTESVTYIVQRAESLCGLFYLLAMYCAAAGFSSESKRHRGAWHAGAVLCCLAAMGVKPVAVTLPLMVLLYDRAFFTRGFLPAIRKSPAIYVGLTACWAAFGLLLAGRQMGVSAGFEVPNLTPWEYLRSQPGVLLHYLQLSFWPKDLCLDYAWPVARSFAAIALPAAVVLALLGVTVWMVARNRPAGFLGAWFFGILALTSSVVPIADLCVEHRMYLSLAAVVLSALLIARWAIRRLVRDEFTRGPVFWALVAASALALGARTYQRNEDYGSSMKLWEDVVRQNPNHGRAWTNLSHGFFFAGKTDAAVNAARRAIEIDPRDSVAYCNLGRYLLAQGWDDEALKMYLKAREINPNLAAAQYNIGNIRRAQGRFEEAVTCYEKAVELEPWNALTWNNLGIALAQWRLDGDGPEEALPRALKAFEESVRLKPDHVAAWNSMGMALARWGLEKGGPPDWIERAEAAFREALRIDPNFLPAKDNLEKLGPVKKRKNAE
jgi:tetratricopeptide (TPR) repeat protein